MSSVQFFAKFLCKPTQIGALCPSSPGLCRAMTRRIGVENAGCVVELGPGTGVITREILRVMPENAEFVSVELDRTLCSQLRSSFPEHVHVVNDSAANLKEILAQFNLTRADAVLSGLPWAAFPQALQQEVLDSVLSILAPGGYFTTFAYLSGLPLPAGRRFRRLLERNFTSVELSPVIWCNLPPAVIYRCHN